MITIYIRKSEQTNEEYALFISFPYNADIIDIIREQLVRYWNKENKEWEVPFSSLKGLLDSFNFYGFDVDIYAESGDVFRDVAADVPAEFEYKTTPFEHQREALAYGLSHSKWLLGDEMGLGKALALDTKVFTPDGFKHMRDIKVGDYVFGRDGMPTKVIATYDHENVEMYRITFSDGASVECCKDHLWKIYDQHGSKVVDTKWFMEKDQFGNIRKDNLKAKNYYKYWIDRCEPIQFETKSVPIDPYVLGAILGNGGLTSSSIFLSTADAEMIKSINDKLPVGYELVSSDSMSDINYFVRGTKGKPNYVKQSLVDMGLWKANSHTKFIPNMYKYNSIDVRTKVLQGLLDTDGYASNDNLLQYTSVSKQLCDDVRFLVESLGGIANYSTKSCGYNGKITGISHNLTIRFDNPRLYVTLTRKKSLLKERKFKPHRSIISIERVENSNAKCITVDNAEHLYVIEHFIVTHNTKQAIDIAVAKKLQNGYKHCLILCCVNGLKWNWQAEVKKHSNENCWILGQKLKKDRMKNIRMVVGSSQDKLEDLVYLQTGGNTDIDDSYFIITNVESLRYREWTGTYKTSRNGKQVKVYDYPIADKLTELCNSGVIDMIVADEIHLGVKNPDSEQGNAFLKLNAKTMIGMTGTPLMNSPTDLYVPLKWLGVESHSQYNFNHHYCVYGGYGDHKILGHKNLDELQKRLDTIMLRRKKADVLDLPEKIYINEYVDMTAKQAVIYNEVTMDVQSNIDQIKSATNPLSELIRLRQATGYTGILSSQVQESAKLDRLVEIVKDTLSNDQQLVIFSNWTQMTDAIETRLINNEIYSYGVITGNTKDEERQAIVNAFQNGEIKIIVGTIGAAGTGITLTAGTVEIFFDHPWTMAAYSQAVDRCHRPGQTHNITIYNLLTKNTIDERIWELVQEKGEMSDLLVDKSRDLSKGELVDFLLS